MTGTLGLMPEIAALLGSSGIKDAHKESEIILTACLGLDRVALYRDDPVLSEKQQYELKEILRRRREREPIQYIIGNVDFYGLKISVGPGVLIPRPETELLVEEVIRAVKGETVDVKPGENSFLRARHSPLRVLDLCTGSGCIALALAKKLPEAEVVGTDISEKALAYARRNAGSNGLGNAYFLRGDLYGPVRGMRFDVIVSNPPYIRTSEMETLQPEIRRWEPDEALDGGEDGLTFYRKILSLAAEHLKDDGLVVMELGAEESEAVKAFAEQNGFTSLSVVKDYSGIERILRLSIR